MMCYDKTQEMSRAKKLLHDFSNSVRTAEPYKLCADKTS